MLSEKMSSSFTVGYKLTVLLMGLLLAGCGGGSNNTIGVVALTGWQRDSTNPLIVPTVTTSTLNYGPADPSVLYDPDDNKWKVWFSSTDEGLNSGVKTGVKTISIKYAESSDGVHWTDPQTAFQVATDSSAWDHTNVETPSVIINPDAGAPASEKFMLYYAGANTDLAVSENRPTTFPYYQIGLAYSADGKFFTRYSPGLNNKPGLVLVADAALFGTLSGGTFGDGLVADPSVVVKDGVYHMWFSSYAETVTASGRTPLAFGISHVTSSDGITWSAGGQDNPLNTLAKTGETSAGQQPSVLFNTGTNQFEMWFSNDSDTEKQAIPCSFNTVTGFWHAVSTDGITWTPDYTARDLSYDNSLGYEAYGFLTGVDALLVNGTYYLYYSAWGSTQIPDQSLYLCPDQTGALFPAVLTLNRASLTSR